MIGATYSESGSWRDTAQTPPWSPVSRRSTSATGMSTCPCHPLPDARGHLTSFGFFLPVRLPPPYSDLVQRAHRLPEVSGTMTRPPLIRAACAAALVSVVPLLALAKDPPA